MDIVEKLTNYLESGGLFNPEAMDHDAVRDMIILARNEIEFLRKRIDSLENISIDRAVSLGLLD